jgi:hypothetical protein
MRGWAQGIISRCAAAAVALVLSGTVELVAPPEGPAGHRCHCPVRDGHHDCDCPICLAEAARLGRSAAEDPNLPPCHRALAAKARAEADKSDQRRAASAPCLNNPCGTSDRKLRPPPSADRFLVPPAWQPAGAGVAAAVAVKPERFLVVLREPETPPPRGV